jgi:hypothetical protein
MRLQFILCKVMQREAYFCAARSKNIVDIVLMPQGLHDEPDKLREEVQKALNNNHDIQGRPYDAMLRYWVMAFAAMELSDYLRKSRLSCRVVMTV